MSSYISVVYNRDRTPLTKYPTELVSYLFKRFHMEPYLMLIDIGCGVGDFLYAFKQAGLKCCGIDIYDPIEGHIQTRKSNVLFDPLLFSSNTIDIVFHKSLIEHLQSCDNIMKESYRVLKPGGRLIIMTPDWRSQMKVFYEDPTHIHPYDITSIRDLLDIYGFKAIESERFFQLPSAWKHKSVKTLCKMLSLILPVDMARATKIKFLRWSVESMVLGTGIK